MPSLDTNVLLRIVLRDNESMLQKARTLFSEHQSFYVEDLALIEMEYIITGYYEYSRKEYCEILRTLFFPNQHLDFDRELFGEVLKLYSKHTAESIDDCYLATQAKKRDTTPLYTFDKKMARDLSHVELIS